MSSIQDPNFQEKLIDGDGEQNLSIDHVRTLYVFGKFHLTKFLSKKSVLKQFFKNSELCQPRLGRKF